MFSKVSLALAVAVAGIAGMAAAPQTASADDWGYGYGGYGAYSQSYHVNTYKTIVAYKLKTIPYQKRIVLYHPCGTPYVVWKTYYKTIRVPYYKRIRTCGGYRH